MKKFFYIIGLMICLQIGLFVPYITAQNSQVRDLPNLSQLEASMQHGQLSTPQRHAFEERGKQKLLDFFEYAKLLSSEKIDPLWQAHLAEQIIHLFIEDSISCLGKSSVSRFIKSPPERSYKIVSWNMELTRTFEEKEGPRTAMIHAQMTPSEGPPFEIQCELHLVRRPKAFGKEEIIAWKVLLGKLVII